MYDVAIVGGGVIGCAIAHELGRFTASVVLLESEAEVGFGTSKANSGIIHGGHHASPDTLKGRLEWEGNQLWDALCDELGFAFSRVGELTVALHDDEIPALDRLQEHAERKGVPAVERWDRHRVLAAEPALTPHLVAAVHAETTAVVNPYEACYGLAESATANGVELRCATRVEALIAEHDGWTVRTTDGDLGSRFVVNAAGLRAGEVAAMAGIDGVEITARKGEEYLLDKRLQGLVRHVIYPCPQAQSKGTLVIPTYDGTIMVGPTAEMADDPDDLTTTSAGAERVIAGARRLVPGISERDVIAEFAGNRAVLPSEDFLIEETDAAGFFNVAGIQSPGLTAAPAIALMVVDLLQEAGMDHPLRPSGIEPLARPVHFASLSTGEQVELAHIDPRYRRIACRCELVTEGEVRDAIARGASTLDGIKFRTRAGMGRCQGGFCTPRCIELLARDLGIPISSVTKRGGGSWLVRERSSPVEGVEP